MIYQVQVYIPYILSPYIVYSWAVCTSEVDAKVAALEAVGTGYAIHKIKEIRGG